MCCMFDELTKRICSLISHSKHKSFCILENKSSFCFFVLEDSFSQHDYFDKLSMDTTSSFGESVAIRLAAVSQFIIS